MDGEISTPHFLTQVTSVHHPISIIYDVTLLLLDSPAVRRKKDEPPASPKTLRHLPLFTIDLRKAH